MMIHAKPPKRYKGPGSGKGKENPERKRKKTKTAERSYRKKPGLESSEGLK